MKPLITAACNRLVSLFHEGTISRLRVFLILASLGLFGGFLRAAESPAWLAQDKHTVFLADFNGSTPEAQFSAAGSRVGQGTWRLVKGLHGKALALEGDETLVFDLHAKNNFAAGTVEVIYRDLAEGGKYLYANEANRRYHLRPFFAMLGSRFAFSLVNYMGNCGYLCLQFPPKDHTPGYPRVDALANASWDKLPNEWICLAGGWDAKRGLVACVVRDASTGEPLGLIPDNRKVERFPTHAMDPMANAPEFASFTIGPAPEILVDAIRISDVFRDEVFESPRGPALGDLPVRTTPIAPEEIQ